MFLRKFMVVRPDGPLQVCIYTISGDDRIYVDGDVCYQYIKPTPEQIQHSLNVAH